MRNVSLALLAIISFSFLAACGGGSSTPTSPSSTSVVLTVVGGTPTSAAVQIAGGNWTALTFSGSTATFTVPEESSTYAIAVLCPVDTSQSVQAETIYEATAADTTSPTTGCPLTTTVPQVVNYDVTAVGGSNAEAAVSIGSTISSFWTGGASAANMTGVSPGKQDVAVAAYPNPPSSSALGVQIERGVDITGAPITVPAMSASDVAGSAPVTVDGVPSGYTNSISAIYVTAGGTDVLLNGNGATSYATVAAADSMSGDYYAVQSQAINSGENNLVESVQAFAEPQTLTMTLPGVLNYSGPAAAAYPTFNVSYSGFTVTGGKTGSIAGLQWSVSGISDVIVVYATSSFVGSNPVSIPNLSSLSGYLAPPASGTTVTWSAGAFSQSVLYFIEAVDAIPTNENAQYALTSGTFIEP